MNKVTPVTLTELFEAKVKVRKDADALKAVESIFDAYHIGWLKAIEEKKTNLGSSAEGCAEIACELLKEIPRYSALAETSRRLLVQIVRGWIATDDIEKEKIFADMFVFARLPGFPEALSQELENMGYKTVEKVYRVFARLSVVQINHNLSTRVLAETLSSARPEHLIAMGKIFATGAVDLYFVEFRLPRLIRGLGRIAKK